MIRMLFVTLVSVGSLVLTMNISMYESSSDFLNEDLEVAVHDAALSVDFQQFSKGEIVFDAAAAKSEFEKSLELNDNLKPGDYKILRFKVLDDSNTTFPFTYNDPDFKYTNTFFGPTILAIVQTNSNQYFSYNKTIRKSASYSYKIK